MNLLSHGESCLASGESGQVQELAAPDARVVKVVFEHDVPITAQDLSADDQLLAIGDTTGALAILQPRDGKYEPLFRISCFNRPIRRLDFNKDASRLCIVVHDDSRAYILELRRVLERLDELRLLSDSAINAAR